MTVEPPSKVARLEPKSRLSYLQVDRVEGLLDTGSWLMQGHLQTTRLRIGKVSARQTCRKLPPVNDGSC